jgi:hypothetical protein
MLSFQCLYWSGEVSKVTDGRAAVCSTGEVYYGFKRSFKSWYNVADDGSACPKATARHTL